MRKGRALSAVGHIWELERATGPREELSGLMTLLEKSQWKAESCPWPKNFGCLRSSLCLKPANSPVKGK